MPCRDGKAVTGGIFRPRPTCADFCPLEPDEAPSEEADHPDGES